MYEAWASYANPRKGAPKSGPGKPSSISKTPYKQLWQAKPPYAKRPKKAAKGLLGVAQGFRPIGAQVKAEQRAVILGGLLALKSAGIEPFTQLDLDSLPNKMKQPREDDLILIQAVKQTTGKQLKGSLAAAARAIQDIVAENKLEEVAWPARASFLLNAFQSRASITKASASALALGTSTAAGIVAGAGAAPPWVQNIVTAPAAGILGLVSLVATGVGSAAAVKSTQAKGVAEQYQREFEQNLNLWSSDTQVASERGLSRKLQLQAAQAHSVETQQAAKRAEQWTGTIQTIAWVGGVAVAGTGLYLLYRHFWSNQ